MENLIEQLKAEAEKKAEVEKKTQEKLAEAQKSLEANPDDAALKKKVQGLTLAHKNAAEKAAAAQKALQDAQGGNGGETPKGENDGNSDKNAGNKTSGGNDGETADAQKIRIRCRSKTGKPAYFRAGLRFTPADAEYEVTEDVAEILRNDPWLEVKTIE